MTIDIQTLRAAALKLATALHLHEKVCAAAMLELPDDAGARDYTCVTWQGRRVLIRTTSDGNAWVWIDTPEVLEKWAQSPNTGPDGEPTLLVYESIDYGRTLRAFRPGWWVANVMEHAFRYHQRDIEDRMWRENEHLLKAAEAYKPLPD